MVVDGENQPETDTEQIERHARHKSEIRLARSDFGEIFEQDNKRKPCTDTLADYGRPRGPTDGKSRQEKQGKTGTMGNYKLQVTNYK